MAICCSNVCRTTPYDVILLIVLLVTSIAQASHHSSSTAQMNACGPTKITLSADHPEHMLTFPGEGSKHLASGFNLNEWTNNNASTDSATNRSSTVKFIPEAGYLYRCHWVITTDSNHAISAIFDFTSDNEYSLSAEDDYGFIEKKVSNSHYTSKTFSCTTKRCLIESSTPALSLEFHTKQLDAEPATRFEAKFYSTSVASEERHPLVDWWIILVISSSIILVFISISYFFFMKRNLLLTRLIRLLSKGDKSSKSAQAKKKAQLTNGSQAPTGTCRRQHRTSVCSLHAAHFEPMPTIAEEDTEVAESETPTSSHLERNSVRLPQHTTAIRVL